mgnify:CR=1 FL=1
MRYTDNALNIITTRTFKGIGNAWVVKHLKGNESNEQIIDLINAKSKEKSTITYDDFEFEKNKIIQTLESFEDSCDGVVALGDKNFPQHRGEVKSSQQPIYIFYKGDLSLLESDNPSITVIGLLDPTEEIENRERKIVKELVKKDITIVSGLAFGCDSIAHKEALNGGKTVAILPNTLNKIMPAQNKGLAFQIVEEGGLLITEYYEDFKSSRELISRYQERDRLQALYCDTIILAASYAKDSANRWNIYDKKLDSGARLAMGYARDYGIPRAIMYNEKTDKENPMFDLNRELMAEEKDITILTKETIEKIVDDINNKNNLGNAQKQASLFD